MRFAVFTLSIWFSHLLATHWLCIHYRRGYVTPWWLGHTPFITTMKAIEFAWWSFWSWLRTQKHDLVDMEIIWLHVTLWWRIMIILIMVQTTVKCEPVTLQKSILTSHYDHRTQQFRCGGHHSNGLVKSVYCLQSDNGNTVLFVTCIRSFITTGLNFKDGT